MRGGFTFCGVDIADIGLEYAPEASNMYVFRPASFKVHDVTFDGHHGGYFYGTSAEPKEFVLRCYFEDEDIYKGLFAKVYSLFRRGHTGKLVFKERPWCHYTATVTDDVDPSDIIYKRSGVVTIHLTSYYPFARSEIMYCDQGNLWYDDIMQNSAVMTSEAMVPATELTNLSGSMTLAEPLLLNPGTEASPVTIDIAGDVGDGLTITNLTNGQRMMIVGLTPSITGENGFLRVNTRNGQTSLHTFNGSTENVAPGYLYHSGGFIELEPAMLARRDVYASYTSEGIVTTTDVLEQDYTGEYIYLNKAWREIISQDEQRRLRLRGSIGKAGSEVAVIVPMNKLNIYAESSAEISKIAFSYLPTYA